MSDPFIPRWFCTLDGRSLYALEAPDQLVEHQQIGSRHAVHTLEATTYPERLRIADLVDGAAQGHVQELSAEEYERRRVDMASTPRIG